MPKKTSEDDLNEMRLDQQDNDLQIAADIEKEIFEEMNYNDECICSAHTPYGPHSIELSTKEIRVKREPELITLIGEQTWSRVCTNHIKFYQVLNSFEIRDVDVKSTESTSSTHSPKPEV